MRAGATMSDMWKARRVNLVSAWERAAFVVFPLTAVAPPSDPEHALHALHTRRPLVVLLLLFSGAAGTADRGRRGFVDARRLVQGARRGGADPGQAAPRAVDPGADRRGQERQRGGARGVGAVAGADRLADRARHRSGRSTRPGSHRP